MTNPVYADRVRETTTTSGTGTVTLAGAVTGYQSFNTKFTTGTRVSYALLDGNNWEVGYGTFTATNQLSRDTVLDGSSGPGVKITLSGGSTQVFNTEPAAFLNYPPIAIVDAAAYTMISGV